MVWEDPAYNAAVKDINGPDWPFAPEVAASELYASLQSNLADIDVLFFAFRDQCNNTVEMTSNVAAQLGNGEITAEEALRKAAIYGDTGC